MLKVPCHEIVASPVAGSSVPSPSENTTFWPRRAVPPGVTVVPFASLQRVE